MDNEIIIDGKTYTVQGIVKDFIELLSSQNNSLKEKNESLMDRHFKITDILLDKINQQ